MIAPTRQDDITAKILSILRDILPLQTKPVGPQTSLASDLALDSLQQMTFIVELENAFQICLEISSLTTEIHTIADLASYIAKAQSLKGPQV